MKINNFITTILLLLVIFFSNKKGLGQNPDTTNYFPHHLGDVWEYYKYDHLLFTLDTLQIRILNDSIDNFGNSYILLERYLINPYKFEGINGYIIDTLKNVFETNLLYRDLILIYKENAQKGDNWIGQLLGGTSAIMCKLKNVYIDTVLGFPSKSKEIWYYGASDTSDTTVWLAWYKRIISSGFGITYLGGFETFFDMNLKGASINNILYGDTTYITNINSMINKNIINDYKLSQNYPNPFNPSTKIKYIIPKVEKVKIEVINLLGQKIKTILYKHMPAGSHEIEFFAKDLPSGVYLYRIEAGKFQEVKKMILLR
jgi:type IX secretion system substrate protein